MRRLLVVPPKIDDATSYWRAVGPFSAPEFLDAGWLVSFQRQTIDWTVLAEYDALFMQRPWRGDHLALLKAARSMGLRVWVDYDDDLFAVPRSNPAFERYAAPGVHDTMRAIIRQADAVSVSTARLRNVIQELRDDVAPDVALIPNAWNERFHPLTYSGANNTKTIVWRGSMTHDEDLDRHKDDLLEIKRRFPDWKWVLMGDPYWKFVEELGECFVIRSTWDVIDYFQALESVKPTVLIVPLADNPFNHAKSNIAWQEATWAAAACVAPKWDEWDYDCIAHYYPGKRGSLVEAFERAAENPSSYVKESVGLLPRLEDANLLRINLLEGLR